MAGGSDAECFKLVSACSTLEVVHLGACSVRLSEMVQSKDPPPFPAFGKVAEDGDKGMMLNGSPRNLTNTLTVVKNRRQISPVFIHCQGGIGSQVDSCKAAQLSQDGGLSNVIHISLS
ncbi:hypothetical protein HOLleu_20347 [Holothuria leucospilota]|uniref:Uncharacterized protein n=1 Tax=Holothuria leucospilota TaxID=206669 RepID=A0A9Q1H8N3_HOLLE|nr:hypothetical protein HOLleu_20347 [Holothuria leucospilota]